MCGLGSRNAPNFFTPAYTTTESHQLQGSGILKFGIYAGGRCGEGGGDAAAGILWAGWWIWPSAAQPLERSDIFKDPKGLTSEALFTALVFLQTKSYPLTSG